MISSVLCKRKNENLSVPNFDVSDKIKVLDVTKQNNLNRNTPVDRIRMMAAQRIDLLTVMKHLSVSRSELIKVYKSQIQSILEYNARILGTCKTFWGAKTFIPFCSLLKTCSLKKLRTSHELFWFRSCDVIWCLSIAKAERPCCCCWSHAPPSLCKMFYFFVHLWLDDSYLISITSINTLSLLLLPRRKEITRVTFDMLTRPTFIQV